MKRVFKVGDDVKRRKDIFDDKSPYKYGVVVKSYAEFGTRHGDYPELYDVKWCDENVSKAYLPHGIEESK